VKYAEETWVGCTGRYLRDAARFMKHHGGTIDLIGYSELETCDSNILLFRMSNIPFPDPLYSYSKLFNLFHIVVIYSEGKILSWRSSSQSLESTYGSPTVGESPLLSFVFASFLKTGRKWFVIILMEWALRICFCRWVLTLIQQHRFPPTRRSAQNQGTQQRRRPTFTATSRFGFRVNRSNQERTL
jgi:hypothetical protein